jgi:threonine/homoserine/homoserine lactone efflux protein
MPPRELKLFAVATFFIALSPGPNMLLVMSSSVKRGVRRSMATMAGCLTAVVIMLALSAAGVGALLQSAPLVFSALRVGGAAYLAYLGVQMWLSREESAREGATPIAAEPKALYRQGFLVAASNPKALLFAAAFLPQFIDPALPRLPQFAWLVSVFAVIETSCYFTYAFGGKTLAVGLTRSGVRRWFDRVTGTVFIAFAAAMLFEYRR